MYTNSTTKMPDNQLPAISDNTISDKRNNELNETIADKIQHQSLTMSNSTNPNHHDDHVGGLIKNNKLSESQISIVFEPDKTYEHLYHTSLEDEKKSEANRTSYSSNYINEKQIIAKHIEKDAMNNNITSVSRLSSNSFVPALGEHQFSCFTKLGVVQLALSVAMGALGGLVVARESSLAMAGAGIWCGAIAGIVGALGIMNMKSAKTGFLAVSLIAVASSTLGMALSGIGLVRDLNLARNEQTTWGAVYANSWLLIVLVAHFIVSTFSVYYSAMRLCSKSLHTQMMENVMQSNPSLLSHQKVESYIQSLSATDPLGTFKKAEKQFTNSRKTSEAYPVWINVANHMQSSMPPMQRLPHPYMFVQNGNSLPMVPMFPQRPPHHPYPDSMMSMGGAAPQIFLQHPPPPLMFNPMAGTPYDMMYSSTMMRKPHRKQSVQPNHQHSNTMPHSRMRKRRKSETDLEQRANATYTGLDRSIADSFLEQQEKNQISHEKSAEQQKAMDEDKGSYNRYKDIQM